MPTATIRRGDDREIRDALYGASSPWVVPRIGRLASRRYPRANRPRRVENRRWLTWRTAESEIEPRRALHHSSRLPAVLAVVVVVVRELLRRRAINSPASVHSAVLQGYIIYYNAASTSEGGGGGEVYRRVYIAKRGSYAAPVSPRWILLLALQVSIQLSRRADCSILSDSYGRISHRAQPIDIHRSFRKDSRNV